MYVNLNQLNSSHTTGRDVSDTVLPGLIGEILFWQLLNVTLVLNILVATFATGANIVTIVVYHQIGYNITTNISLTALAMSDLGVAITTLFNVFGILLPMIPGAVFTHQIFLNFAATPHVLFARTSALITMYLSIERYLCVSLPLKVKNIFTPRRTLIAMFVFFVVAFCLYPVMFFRYPLGWVYFPQLNRTLVSILPVTDEIILALFYVFQTHISLFLPLLTFFGVLLTTVLLSLSLQKSKKWRDANKSMRPITTTSTTTTSVTTAKRGDGNAPAATTSAPTATTAASSSQEARAVKMVIAITTVFILCSIPSSIQMLAVMLVPEFDLGSRYSNVYVLSGMTFLVVDSINCSCNVIIYYNMSTKFRMAMQSLFRGKSK